MRCFFGHRWVFRGSQPFYHKGDWESGDKTRFLYVCQRCKQVKSKEEWGTWELEPE